MSDVLYCTSVTNCVPSDSKEQATIWKSESILVKQAISYLSYLPFRYCKNCASLRWYLHLVVVVGLVHLSDPKSYAGGSVATGRASLARLVEGERSD